MHFLALSLALAASAEVAAQVPLPVETAPTSVSFSPDPHYLEACAAGRTHACVVLGRAFEQVGELGLMTATLGMACQSGWDSPAEVVRFDLDLVCNIAATGYESGTYLARDPVAARQYALMACQSARSPALAEDAARLLESVGAHPEAETCRGGAEPAI